MIRESGLRGYLTPGQDGNVSSLSAESKTTNRAPELQMDEEAMVTMETKRDASKGVAPRMDEWRFPPPTYD